MTGLTPPVVAHPQNFWFVEKCWKNPWKSGNEIVENLRKTSENLGKITKRPGKNGGQHCLTSQNGGQRSQKDIIGPFLEVTPKQVFISFVGEICGQKAHKNFSGKFGEIRTKFLRTSKNVPAPTPMDPPWVSVPGFWIPINFPSIFCSIPSSTRSIATSNSPRRSSGAQLARTKVARAFMSAWPKSKTNTI